MGYVRGWGWDMFSFVLPLLIPISMFMLLVLSITQIFRIVRRSSALHDAMQKAYSQIQRVHKPEVIDPKHPGNPSYMKEVAQDAIDDLSSLMVHYGFDKDLPTTIDISSEESIRTWYEYVRFNRRRFSLGH